MWLEFERASWIVEKLRLPSHCLGSALLRLWHRSIKRLDLPHVPLRVGGHDLEEIGQVHLEHREEGIRERDSAQVEASRLLRQRDDLLMTGDPAIDNVGSIRCPVRDHLL